MTNLQTLIADFTQVAELAGIPLPQTAITSEELPAPHLPPKPLPRDKMAVYIFWWGERCLKVGRVGPKSQPRYTSHHYNQKSSGSNLAKSILKEKEILGLGNLDEADVGEWIKRETHRTNLVLDANIGIPVLSLLESFLQCRLKPHFEGFSSQK